MHTSVAFTGGKELERALLELTTKEALKIGRASLRKTANPILKRAKAIVRKKERRVERALRVRLDRDRNDKSLITATVYVSKKAFNYRPRKTDRRSRVKGKLVQALYSYQIGSRPDIYAGFLENGRHKQGVSAYPFMRPAWDMEGGQIAINRLGAELGPAIEAAAERLRRGI